MLYFIKIEKYHSPRASFTQFLFAMLKVLEPVLPLQKKDIEEAINGLKLIVNLLKFNLVLYFFVN